MLCLPIILKSSTGIRLCGAVIKCHGYLFTSHASARDLKVPISTITEIMSAGS